ncbi:MAG: arsenosugar biosynthesis radical SAM (seleno)protein ArsS [Cyanobacteriota bacterium]|jgi:radical SAM/Cys-rich protein
MKTQIRTFAQRLGAPLTKSLITTLQINLGRRCNLACSHCHVEAGPKRTEEMTAELAAQLVAVIERFPQIETVDLTGGAPEMGQGFRELVEAGRRLGKEVIVRSNLTIFFAAGYGDLPHYFAQNQVRVVASLPCYLPENVDQQRGAGVYLDSIRALQWLNALGYGQNPQLILDLVYNPPLPQGAAEFRLPPPQESLEQDYRNYLRQHFQIRFNRLLTLTNLPIGRARQTLERQGLAELYLDFLSRNHNPATVAQLMCRPQLSVDYLGNLYDCDFNQMENRPARTPEGRALTVADLLAVGSLDLLQTVATADYCYGCTAGSGSSCGGALVV